MSSVSVISGVAVRIAYLIHEPTELQRSLLSEMESTAELLKTAELETKTSKRFIVLEKLLVQLSYEIEEAVELRILSKLKPRAANMFRPAPLHLKSFVTFLKNLRSLLDYVIVENIIPQLYVAASGDGDRDGAGAAVVEARVRECMRGPDSSSSVVCIYGASGSGKTSLAKKVFDEARGGGFFQSFAWVRVNSECKPRRVFEEILQQLNPAKTKADIRGIGEIEMTRQIIAIQKEKRCLIVLEDIWGVRDWNHIRFALLVGRSSRILITTHSSKLANEMVKCECQLCEMQPLNRAEAAILLKNKAGFDDRDAERYEEIISTISQGSPLFVVALGKSIKAAGYELVDELEMYRNRISQGETHTLDICYDILPDELKAFWIYMGQFPEGQEIEVEKLRLLLEAEGMMPLENPITGCNNLESIRNILQNLAQRKLVELREDKLSMTTMYESCQLHELIRNFCISKGLERELFEIIRVKSGKQAITIADSTRRLAINLSNYKDQHTITFTNHRTAKKIRSLLIFDTLDGSEQNTRRSSKMKGHQQFSCLRVLDFDGVDFRVRQEVLTVIEKFVLLRYLGFRRCWLEKFPSSISKFLLLETLDLRVRSDCVMIIPKSIISDMKSMKNLYFPMMYKTQERSKLQLRSLQSLEILVNFHTGVCDVNDLSHLKNLQIMTTISEENHGDLAAVLEISDKPESKLQQSCFIIRNFDCYSPDRAILLKRLLECKSLHSLHIQGHISQFPKDVVISPNLSEIVFDGSEIKDEPAVVLQKLNNLRSIVLSNNAFIGEKMFIVFARKHFRNLRSLKLLNLRNLEILQFHKGSMPKLSTLVVDNCADLGQVLMHRALHNRLQAVRRKKGVDVYSVQLPPTII